VCIALHGATVENGTFSNSRSDDGMRAVLELRH
jgi:hypothetical protein